MASMSDHDDDVRIEVARFPTKIRVPWRIRLKAWWHRKTTPANVLAILDRAGAESDRCFLYGEFNKHEPRPAISYAVFDEGHSFITAEALRDMDSVILKSIITRICGDFGVRVSALNSDPHDMYREGREQ